MKPRYPLCAIGRAYIEISWRARDVVECKHEQTPHAQSLFEDLLGCESRLPSPHIRINTRRKMDMPVNVPIDDPNADTEW
jgi:hypothetical protein